MDPALIDFHNVTVRRKGRAVLDGLTLRIPIGENLAILGPNGCGKSTLIKTITRQLYPDPYIEDSWVEIFGKRTWNIFELRSLVGIVSYDWLEFTRRDYPAWEIILSGFLNSVGIWPQHEGLVTEEMRQKTSRVMDLLEISHLAERPTEELSSGEARRVLVARALVHEPKALLLDEPTNSLDIHATHGLREILRKITGQGTSIIMVTHHLPDIIPEINRVVLLRDGRVFSDGPKSEVLREEALADVFRTTVRFARQNGYYHAW